MNNKYQICTNCIMDTSDPDITFDEQGVCCHCFSYRDRLRSRIYSPAEREKKLEQIVSKMKAEGKSKEYDCIIGVSGGVDSTYVAFLTKELGLRALAIHFDNGWNSELAVSNIEKVLNNLNIDLYTYVIDWEEFKDLQRSFLLASTPDGEIPTDHAINALLFKEASKRGIKYIINGMNFATESVAVKGWAYGHSDWKYISSIHRLFGKVKLKHYPHYTFLDLFFWTFIKRIKVISILNYIEYNKEKVMNLLQNELNWVYYGGKHYESIYTRFYQGYVLPEKFKIDKRRGHLSDLIYSGQISRDQALEDLSKEQYPKSLLKEDLIFVKKKLNFSDVEFDKILRANPKRFVDYPNSETTVRTIKKFLNFLRDKGFYSK